MRWLSRAPELRIALVVSWLLVISRSLVYTVFEHAHFDSDQAIVGLMAKHLSEGQAYPLFFYGQTYMLAVESWLAVPFFWIAGPTVAALRSSLILTNIAVVTLLIVGLHRAGLRPYLALVAALFVAFPHANTAALLLEAQGGNIEPFLWVLLLWFVRGRPFWFGALLAVGFLNREFVIYAVPVLVAGQIWSRTLFRRDALRTWLFTLVAFLAVWQGLQALVPFSDGMGPGTRGSAVTATRGSQIENLSQRARIELGGVPSRSGTVLAHGVAGLLGGRRHDGGPGQGREWMTYALGFALLAAVGRVGVLALRRGPSQAGAFAWYVLGVGVVAVVAYAATRPDGEVIRRYLLLSLLIPVSVTALWLLLEPSRIVRRMLVMGVLGWAALAAVDNWRTFERFASGQVPDPTREIVSALEARGISVTEAPYWRAYKITFLSGERVRVASTDVVRITQYQALAQQAGPALIRISEDPCDGGEQMGIWYLCGQR